MEELDELCAVDEGAAVFYARNFFASTTGNVEFLPEVKSVFPVTDENGKVHMYIVNFEPNGFVVTNADIRNTPIFAYSEESDFIVEKEEDLPAALLGLMSNNIDYSNYIRNSVESYGIEGEDISEGIIYNNILEWDILKNYSDFYFYVKSVCFENLFDLLVDTCEGKPTIPLTDTICSTSGILLQTQWGQGEPYNADIETYNDENDSIKHYYAGCTTVAVAQIMRYHRHPADILWDWMPDKIEPKDKKYNQLTSRDSMITQLLAHVVDKFDRVIYNKGGTFVGPRDAKSTLVKDFNYYAEYSKQFDYGRVVTNIYWERRPVFMCGIPEKTDGNAKQKIIVNNIQYSPNSSQDNPDGWRIADAHSFVIDGYRKAASRHIRCDGLISLNHYTSYLHFNFGWRGNKDCWIRVGFYYKRDKLCNEIVFRDSLTDENYIYRQRFIYDIYPKKQ